MSSQPVPVRLPDEVERLLEAWPADDRPDDFWEQLAQTTEARFGLTPLGSTPELLLAAPLPATAEELAGSELAAAAEVAPVPADATPVGSLTELARARVAERQQEAKQSAGASLALAAQLRRELPRASDPAREPPKDSKPSVPPPPRESAPPSRQARGRDSRSNPLPWLGGALAVLAAAAAVFVLIGRPSRVEPAVAEQPPASVADPSPLAVAPAAPAPQKAAEPTRGISPEQLPTAEPRARAPERVAAAPASKKLRAAAGPSPGEPAPAAPPPATTADELPPNPKLKLADDEERPSRPSTGAVISAVGTVMGGARACVAGHQAPSRAALVFGSDGRVQSVAVTGPAAGTPAEACIKAALSGARVQPFAEDTFSIAVPVRP
jgi:hypothetical protein